MYREEQSYLIPINITDDFEYELNRAYITNDFSLFDRMFGKYKKNLSEADLWAKQIAYER